MSAATSLSFEEQSRLRTRALAKWLTSGGWKTDVRVAVDAATAEMHEHDGHLFVMVTAGGQAVAQYRVVVRAKNCCLRREAHDCMTSSARSPEWLVPWDRPRVLAHSAALRARSVALSSRSAELRSRTAATLSRAAAYLATSARG